MTNAPAASPVPPRLALGPLLALAAAIIVVHWLFGDRYGFHRDELATLSDARQLAWGYVAYPPVTPFFGWLSLHLFGTSLAGFRFFASLAGAVAIVLTGALTRDLGGGRGAQCFAALAGSAFPFAAGTLMQYVSFDYLAWVLVAFFVGRLCLTNDPRWWLALGAAIAFGMLSKYSMPFLIVGLGVGCLTNRELRAHLGTRWPWLGALLALALFAPNLIWQYQHDFISLQFLRSIHARDVRIGRTKDFLPDQLLLMLLALPIALSGLVFYFWRGKGTRFRTLGWMFVVPFLLFIVLRGRGYYIAAGYPILYAGGAVLLAAWARKLARPWRITVGALGWSALLCDLALVAAFFLPLAPINSPWWHRAVKVNVDLKEQIGWPDLVENVARLCATLSPEDRARVRILANNYGEAGALELYGPAFGLPPVICPVNSFWAHGYGETPPELLIVLGSSRARLEQWCESVESFGVVTNREGVPNEESVDHPGIFLCRKWRFAWPELWLKMRTFG